MATSLIIISIALFLSATAAAILVYYYRKHTGIIGQLSIDNKRIIDQNAYYEKCLSTSLEKIQYYETDFEKTSAEIKEITNENYLLITWFNEFITRIKFVESKIQSIDVLGSFEADDETGAIYKEIKEMAVLLVEMRKLIELQTEEKEKE